MTAAKLRRGAVATSAILARWRTNRLTKIAAVLLTKVTYPFILAADAFGKKVAH